MTISMTKVPRPIPILAAHLRYPLLLAGIFLAAHLLFRIIFFAYNATSGGSYTTGEALIAFLVGFRYDVATLFLTMGPILLFFSLPIGGMRKRWPYVAGNILFVLVLVITVVVNGIDIIYYGFSSKRLTHELFTTTGDVNAFSPTDILPYWWLMLCLGALLVLVVRLLRRQSVAHRARLAALPSGGTPIWPWMAPVLVGLIAFVGIRGGFQLRPLRPANAFVTSSFFLGNVGLNTAYTIISSIDIGQERPIAFMDPAEAVKITRASIRNDFDGEFVSDQYPLVRKAEFEGDEQHYNVVLLIVESFNALKAGTIMGHPSGQSLTPHFDSLARRGLLFTNFYSNGSRSVESLPALLNGTFDAFARPEIGSSYETNARWGIGNILSSRGYHTSFFCGGENGTMGFDSYSRVSGFVHYFGRNEFPVADASAISKWGVSDGPFLNWIADQQAGFPEPFLTAWFSISNHFPFEVPGDCPAHLRDKGYSPNDLTLAYTDHVIGQYFQKASQMPWYERTIFLITGDHCFYGADDPPRAMMTNFQVPMLIVGPGVAPGRVDRLGSHVNVPPTLIELLRLDTYHANAGVSLLSKTQSPVALNNLMGVVTLAQDSVSYSTNFERVQPCYVVRDGVWAREAALEVEGSEWDRKLRAIYQVCNNVRTANRVISTEWMK